MEHYTQSPLLANLRGVFPQPDIYAREQLCTQLICALDDYYVHLPQKEAAFAIDPVQQLRLLRASDGKGFMRRLIRVISSLRDRHTTLKLSPPWSGLVAYVPFVLERFYEDGRYKYVVAKQLFGFDELPVGTEVSYWNGTPIELHVRSQTGETQGANWDAQIRLAVANLCIRPLSFTLMPQEDWVTLNYIKPNGQAGAITTPWRFYMRPAPQAMEGGHIGEGGTQGYLMGLDEKSSLTNQVRMAAVSGEQKKTQKLSEELNGQLLYGVLPDSLLGNKSQCGYIRLTTFEVPNATQFVSRMASIIASLPQELLLIDIRSNPGGLIPAGQKLIRLLTESEVNPSPVAFRSTSATRELGNLPMFQQWVPSLNIQYSTGQLFSQAFPVTTYEDVPPYRFPGKVGLIIDGLCYSTSDFFTADFKDNNVGVIIGVDNSTGGGGANVWGWNLLSQFSGPSGLGALPNGYDLNLAMRRSLRTGAAQGLPVEDFGIQADVVHKETRRDVLEGNIDLLQFAVNALTHDD